MVIEASRRDCFERFVEVLEPERLWGRLKKKKSYRLWGFLSVNDNKVFWLASALQGERAILLTLTRVRDTLTLESWAHYVSEALQAICSTSLTIEIVQRDVLQRPRSNLSSENICQASFRCLRIALLLVAAKSSWLTSWCWGASWSVAKLEDEPCCLCVSTRQEAVQPHSVIAQADEAWTPAKR